MLMWGAITFGCGIALMMLELIMASRKKEGIEVQDKKRVVGIFWVTLFLSALVMGVLWML